MSPGCQASANDSFVKAVLAHTGKIIHAIHNAQIHFADIILAITQSLFYFIIIE
ncbi:hypothetical protein N480_02390 [Pseudoalteromonas luteoviolacea S2607]|nr:hypothetical protein N480_02390 [Pseudoalteromonas luteoviolacea S2607]